MSNKKQIFCVYDKKSNNYDGFLIYENAAEAIRSFQIACEKNEVFNRWPEDFQLLKILEFTYGEDGFEHEPLVMAEAKDFVRKRTDETKTK